jgi:glyoxylase-like metal-dependent hydrolase (beta-lactamase superfamily II)
MTTDHAVTRLVAPNPGPFTHEGTNTYVVGRATLSIIDPGPDDPGHLATILAHAKGRPITHILITHAHRDHVDGLARLKEATGATTVGFGRAHTHAPADRALDRPTGADFVDADFVPDLTLADGATLITADAMFEAIHTPGHAPDHLCFALAGTPLLFSGDHVMGWSTSVIAPPEGNMGDYLRALERLLTRSETTYLPGHGDRIDEAARTVRAYLIHRQMREQSVLDAIRGGAVTIPEITGLVYSGIADRLLSAARLSVQAHVELLSQKGLLTYETPLTAHRRLALAS